MKTSLLILLLTARRQRKAARLGEAEMLVLLYLQTYGRSKVSDIHESIGIKPPNLSLLMTRLMDRKLVTNSFDSGNRKTVYAALSKRGVVAVTAILDQLSEVPQ